MARVPFFVATPLRYSADAASAYSSILARYAEILRALAGDEGRNVRVEHRGGFQVVATPNGGGEERSPAAEPDAAAAAPAGGRQEPARGEGEEHTIGRQPAERKEPTPEPARGASAAAPRRASNPKAARKVRERKTRATTITSVETNGGSGRGGTPGAPAENTPKTRARSGQGREPAPMGSKDS
jgi:hypothetical protein